MAQLNPDQYVKIGGGSSAYGSSDGLYYDKTNSLLVLVIGGVVVMSLNASGTILAGALEAPDLSVSGQTRGDLLSRGAALWERLAVGTTGQILNTNGTDPSWATVSGDATMASGGALTVTDVTVGSDAAGDLLYKSGATALARLAIGAGGKKLTVNGAGALPVWDNGKILQVSFSGLSAADDPAFHEFDGTVAPGTTGARNTLYCPNGNKLGYWVLGAGQTILGPAGATDAIDIGCDQTDNEGLEIFSHYLEADGRPFSVGIDAAFYFLAKFQLATINGCDDLFVGFRQVGGAAGLEVVNSDAEAYNTFCGLGLNTAATPGAIKQRYELNAGGATNKDTTDTIASATDLQVKILVSAAGVCTVQHDAATPGTLAAPTAVDAFTFDDGDQLIPYFRFLHATAAQAGAVLLKHWECGYQ